MAACWEVERRMWEEERGTAVEAWTVAEREGTAAVAAVVAVGQQWQLALALLSEALGSRRRLPLRHLRGTGGATRSGMQM